MRRIAILMTMSAAAMLRSSRRLPIGTSSVRSPLGLLILLLVPTTYSP